ncbi:MAG TPA: DUF4292 domain-containing protein [Candidatus Binataceae bacterium]|nr:DUF4292 domain-containing protein [Candidatus Binataceae bacterium]
MGRGVRIHRFAWIALPAAVTLLTACATQSATPAAAPAPASAELAILDARERNLTALQTPAIMEYMGPGGHFKAREQITVRRPSSLRVEALTPLGIALVVAAGPTEIAVFDPSKNTITRGAATAATLELVARIPLNPAQAVRLLLALPPDDAALDSAPTSSSEDNGATLLKYSRAEDGRIEIAIAAGDLAMVREIAADGALVYEVRYSDYRDIGAMRFPYTIAANFAPSATTLNLHYERPLIDGAIPDADFVLAPGPQTRELRLGFNSITEPRG